MKMSGKYVLILGSIVSSWLFISGCSNTLEATSEKIVLLDGAVAREENGSHTNYNLTEGKYNKLEVEDIVVVYDTNSGNYIYEKDGKVFVRYEDEDIEIVDKNITNPKLSQGGQYLSYFKKDKYLELVVVRLEKNKKIDISSTVSISGNLMDWNNNNSIIYYGINENKVNGIFSYNLESGNEELIYELESGYLEFLDCLEDDIVFLQKTAENEKLLKLIDKDKEVQVLTDQIVELRDMKVTENGMFILGKMRDENYSIYEVKDGKVNRLIYDFPNLIHLEKGLSSDSNGNILFVGSIDSFEKENIYMYEDGYVKSVTSDDLKYYFVDIQ